MFSGEGVWAAGPSLQGGTLSRGTLRRGRTGEGACAYVVRALSHPEASMHEISPMPNTEDLTPNT